MAKKTPAADQPKKTLTEQHVLVENTGQARSDVAKDVKIPTGPFLIAITVTRSGGTHSTLGTFVMKASAPAGYTGKIDDLKEVSGVTLELPKGNYDIGIGKGAKDYPIPTGTHSGTASARFDYFMVEVNDVDGFDGIQLHLGNGPWNTHACILVGSTAESAKKISASDLGAHSGKWDDFVTLGFIKEDAAPAGAASSAGEKPAATAKTGVSDWIGGSGTKLVEMKKLYDATKAKADAASVGVSITIEVK